MTAQEEDQHWIAARVAWNSLRSEEKRRHSRETWLKQQADARRHATDQQQAYDARQQAVRQQTARDNAARAARVFDKTCPDCRLVRTPSGSCDCQP